MGGTEWTQSLSAAEIPRVVVIGVDEDASGLSSISSWIALSSGTFAMLSLVLLVDGKVTVAISDDIESFPRKSTVSMDQLKGRACLGRRHGSGHNQIGPGNTEGEIVLVGHQVLSWKKGNRRLHLNRKHHEVVPSWKVSGGHRFLGLHRYPHQATADAQCADLHAERVLLPSRH